MAKGETLAKSLHTISVLVNLGRHYKHSQNLSSDQAVSMALIMIKQDGKPDPYGLAEQAAKQLDKEAAR